MITAASVAAQDQKLVSARPGELAHVQNHA
jgi:hypothetical protein